jgi:hypothetical protein
VALPLALMAFVVLGAFSAALLAVGSSEVQIASNHLGATQANFMAEAGLEHAFNTLRTTPSYTTSASATPTYIAYNSQFGGAGNAVGKYMVTYQTAGTYTFRVVSTGTSFIGGIGGLGGDQQATAQKILRAVMSTYFHSNDAILTNDDLTVGGSTDVLSTGGECGNVHTNDELHVSGSVSISGSATASDHYETSGNPSVGAGSGGDKPKHAVPVINPTDFLNAAKASLSADHLFQMKANGQVLNGSDALITTLASGDSFSLAGVNCGWTYTSGTPLAQWTFNGNTFCDGTYYFEGNAKVVSSPGSVDTPWETTLIATGDIELAGNPTIGVDANYTVKDTLLVAGLDVKINGTPSGGYNGLIAAHEQFSLSGNGTFNGFIIGEDASHTSDTVTSTTVSGNITLTYDCNSNPPLQGPLQFLSWGL